jgi:hypothetical protein
MSELAMLQRQEASALCDYEDARGKNEPAALVLELSAVYHFAANALAKALVAEVKRIQDQQNEIDAHRAAVIKSQRRARRRA